MAQTIGTRVPPDPATRSTGPALTLAAAGTGLVALVVLVLTQVASRWDAPALTWVTDHRTGAWESFGRFGGALAGGPAVIVLGLLTITVLWLLHDRAAAALMAVLLLAAGALTVLGKSGVGRARPPEAVQVAPVETGFSFPSGHTLFAVALWGGAALLLAPHLRARAVRVSVAAVATAVVLVVAVSRLVLGYHWVSDVVASLLVGTCLLAVTALAAHDVRIPWPVVLTVRVPRTEPLVPPPGPERAGARGPRR